jgi:hypothetical protein
MELGLLMITTFIGFISTSISVYFYEARKDGFKLTQKQYVVMSICITITIICLLIPIPSVLKLLIETTIRDVELWKAGFFVP